MSHESLPFFALALLLAGAALVLFAAVHDIVARTVPNGLSVTLVLLGLGMRAMDGNLLKGLLAGFVVFAAAAFLWRRGWLGGGDVKLLGATSLLVPPAAVPSFIVAMSLSGGVLAVMYLAAGRLARSMRRSGPDRRARPRHLPARAVRAELWRLRRGGPLPYACAIAAGFLISIT